MAIHGLTIYLLKEEVLDPTESINFEVATGLESLSFPGVEPWPLAIRQGEERYPDWALFFQNFLDLDVFGKTHSIGALLLIPVSGRWFGLTFGTGRFLLRPGTWEERFGLRVALNSIDEDKLRSIDKKTFDAVSLHAREQASEDSGTSAFGLDVERDLLRAVTGTPSKAELGKRLAGMDSLKAHIEVELPVVGTVLSRYCEKYREDSYRKKFPWVDHISEVTDKTIINKLDELIVRRLRVRDYKGIWLACPEIVEWSDVRGFRYGQSRKYLEYYDLRLSQFILSVDDPQAVNREMLARRRVFCVRDDDRVMKDWSIYDCLNCEVDYEESAFLLSFGHWYRIAQGFVAKVNSFVGICLPPFLATEAAARRHDWKRLVFPANMV